MLVSLNKYFLSFKKKKFHFYFSQLQILKNNFFNFPRSLIEKLTQFHIINMNKTITINECPLLEVNRE
ncbi:hypothetical protein EUGRSUZ_G00807 [Eucalyptus grandis]|uniref:Uncharacterized protein n=2 Tax=Eucalyptus grandis TaxID=71139 RepID=A0ACC3K0Z3_EUCGR|nr:hypothetical protein EUGRSUZ_G00807 [Eucalyptus grandis]